MSVAAPVPPNPDPVRRLRHIVPATVLGAWTTSSVGVAVEEHGIGVFQLHINKHGELSVPLFVIVVAALGPNNRQHAGR